MSDASVSVIVDNTELGTVQVLVQVRGYGTNTDTGISTRSGINFRDDLKRFKPRCQAKESNRKNKFFREA